MSDDVRTDADAATSEGAGGEAVTCAVIRKALGEYRCQHSLYAYGSGSMALVDVLTPDGESSIESGLDELTLLAEHITDAVVAALSREKATAVEAAWRDGRRTGWSAGICFAPVSVGCYEDSAVEDGAWLNSRSRAALEAK